MASLISWGRKKWYLKKAAIFPQALLRGNDRSRPIAFFLRDRRFFVQRSGAAPENGKIATPFSRQPSSNIKTF
ncbi:MAG: hypothetical protein ACRER8_12600 [Pseudomonas sp.]|uniref:hypothetical protein n=1 Tax=Pseudomonas sp. TaxID=306 RepID=UPI003D6F654F